MGMYTTIISTYQAKYTRSPWSISNDASGRRTIRLATFCFNTSQNLLWSRGSLYDDIVSIARKRKGLTSRSSSISTCGGIITNGKCGPKVFLNSAKYDAASSMEIMPVLITSSFRAVRIEKIEPLMLSILPDGAACKEILLWSAGKYIDGPAK